MTAKVGRSRETIPIRIFYTRRMNLERLATRHPILAISLAPCMGALLVLALPFIGWFVLFSAIVARLRHHPRVHAQQDPLV